MDRHGWDERYATRDPTFTRSPNPLVEEELAGVAPGRALDLGCGEGRHAAWLSALGWRVVGVDFSIVGLRRARQRAPAAAFVLADVDTLRLGGAGFDLVLASFFRPSSYAAVTAALAPGGTFLHVSYDRANLSEGKGGPQNPDHLIDRPKLVAELTRLGLRVERAAKVRVGEAVDAVVRAVLPRL